MGNERAVPQLLIAGAGEGWTTKQTSAGLWVSQPAQPSLNAYEALYRDALQGE